MLGSILLPSYKVSLCSSDSKVGRKFAFKCEHANMRTYYLAADSQESMSEWVEAIKLACMLQTNVESIDRQSGPSLSSANHNPSIDNSDSGFHQPYTNVVHPPHTYPKHQAQPQTHQMQQQNYISNFQPLYANAPPKPRRQNDGYIHNQEYPPEMYSTPSSSTNTPGYQNNPVAPMQYNANMQQHYCSRSPVNIYRNCDNVPLPQFVNHNQQNHNVPIYYMQYPHAITNNNGMQNNERRTPDTYGRSKQSMGRSKDTSDYEDIYADEVMYKRPLSPIAYSNIKKISPVSTIPVLPIHRPYTLFNNAGAQRPQNFIQVRYQHKQPNKNN